MIATKDLQKFCKLNVFCTSELIDTDTFQKKKICHTVRPQKVSRVLVRDSCKVPLVIFFFSFFPSLDYREMEVTLKAAIIQA